MAQSIITTIQVRGIGAFAGAVLGAAALAGCASDGNAQADGEPNADASTTLTATASETGSSDTVKATSTETTAAPITSDETTAAETTTTEAPPETSAVTEPPTTATTQASMINQAEPELRFDYGEIDRFERVDGVDWIWFDRHGFGDQQGVELQVEPRYEMATDWHGGGNVNPKLRSYPLASNVNILELDPGDFVAGCADLSLDWDFIESDLASIKALDSLVSLTFNENNQVTLIRDQRAC
ncbi:MAG: hypothetical protein ACRBK7_22495 [Acidimicrobiales bacterium]